MADSEGYGKIIISTLMGAALGITITYSTSVASNRTEIVRLSTQVEALRLSIESGMVDRYKGADASRDFALVAQQILSIRNNEARVEAELREHLREHE